MLTTERRGTRRKAVRQSTPASMPPPKVIATEDAPETAAKVATAAGRRPGAASTWM